MLWSWSTTTSSTPITAGHFYFRAAVLTLSHSVHDKKQSSTRDSDAQANFHLCSFCFSSPVTHLNEHAIISWAVSPFASTFFPVKSHIVPIAVPSTQNDITSLQHNVNCCVSAGNRIDMFLESATGMRLIFSFHSRTMENRLLVLIRRTAYNQMTYFTTK